MNHDNSIAKALQVVGIAAIIIGVIAGLLYATSEALEILGPLRGFLGFAVFINGVIGGLLFLGFAEVIKLLQGIYNQGEESAGRITGQEPINSFTGQKTATDERPPVNRLKESERLAINKFYHERKEQPVQILSTSKNDYFFVELENRREIIELGGFKPRIISEERAKVDPEFENYFK
ncbi:hypothetical protein [Indiicoccus explosivorum]|uniref:hypothetical protein n=1 Tax=Indiicoccus explosivorum TaxID=1917864 RepID=UPI000B453655|nr:hypothetical protein [Indiicoccus explosivorum]